MSFYDESDPNVAPQEFEQFPSGEHGVAGIFEYISKDDNGVPLYKETNNRLQTLIRLRLTDGNEGPPMSCTPADLVLLVKAFAGEAALKLLPEDRGTVQFLLRVKQVANCEAPEQSGRTTNKQTAYVGKKGFVRNVSGATLPIDQIFRFALDSVTNMDYSTENLHFTPVEAFHNNRMIRITLRVVGDMSGNKTLYDGALVPVLLGDPFEGSREVTTPDGRTATLPAFKVNPNKSQPRDVARLRQLVNIFCPQINDYEWVKDMTRSQYGTNEVENPIVVIAAKALTGNGIGVGKLSMPQKSKNPTPRIDILDLVPMGSEGMSRDLPTAQRPVDTVANTNLVALYELINDYVLDKYGVSAFNPGTRALSGSGTAWAQSDLAPVWDELKLPNPRRIAELTEEQADLLTGRLLEKLGWPKHKTDSVPEPADF